ncbi:hypothetical protein GCM10022261_09850 [Brevibacterium daeguense]|uniref:Uncharacterized protein n=1 Tax=Brevibacterium daeguense TaxID=909936 RepID=A0ABP8EHL8_9MICO|nr:hypothetical protein [Brevibacterium daeguense]
MSAQLRFVRGLLAAVISLIVGLMFHESADGAVPVPAVVVSLVMLTWLSVLLAGRRFGYWSLTAIVAAAQLMLHCTMVLFSGSPPTLRGHQHGVSPGDALADALASSAAAGHVHGTAEATAAHSAAPSGAMALAHVAATLVTVLVLKRGEDALFRLLVLMLGAGVVIFFELVPIPQPPRVATPRPAPRLTVTDAVLENSYRRGPPMSLAA